MTRAEVVARARSAIGKGVKYQLGAGGMNPRTPLPSDESDRCDCSGFVAWVYGYKRYLPDYAGLVKFNGGWMNTAGMLYDAGQSSGLWESTIRVALFTGDPPRLPMLHGLVAVYAAGPGFKHGHCGIWVSRSSAGEPSFIHCASSNRPDAIQETSPKVILANPNVKFLRYAGLED